MIEAIRDARSVYLDTSPFIYFIEANPQFSTLVRPVLQSIASGEKEGVSSYVTLLELLVKPLREDRADLAQRYRDALVGQRHFRLVGVGRSVAEEAARIRATHGFRVPDAIQLATAALEHADVFLTNDDALRSFPDLAVVVLQDHVGRA